VKQWFWKPYSRKDDAMAKKKAAKKKAAKKKPAKKKARR
jgi:hypothetical protein